MIAIDLNLFMCKDWEYCIILITQQSQDRISTKMLKILITFLAIYSAQCGDNIIDFAADVPSPAISSSRQQLRAVEKLTGDKYIEYLHDIGFEISAQLFVTKAQVKASDLYDESAYLPSAKEQAKCRIYPTDITLKGLSFLNETHQPFDIALLPKRELTADQHVIKGYAAFEHNMIEQFDIISHPESRQMPEIKRISSVRIIPEKDTDQENSPTAHKPHLVAMGTSLYAFNGYNAYVYGGGADGEDKFIKLNGFNAPTTNSESDKVVEVGQIDKSRLYVASNARIDIYQILEEDQTKLKLLKSYDDLQMGTFVPIAVHYDSPSKTFFLATFGFVYTVEIGDIAPLPTIRILQTNGTCNFMQMHQSTLHLSCRFNNIGYVAEIYLNSQDELKINRYYSDMDIYDVNVVRKIGDGIMLLVGDDELRVQNYGVNKQIIREMHHQQPNFNFEFSNGKDILELPEMHTNRNFYFLGLFEDKIQLMDIHQEPPQLYCESYPEEKDGVSYSVLMKINSTTCSFNQSLNQWSNTHDLMSLCQVSIPLKITTTPNIVIKVAKAGHALAIALVVLAVMIALIAIMWSFRRWRGLDDKLQALTHQLEKLRKRGHKGPAKI